MPVRTVSPAGIWPRLRPCAAGGSSGGALDCSVHGGPSDGEQFGQLGDRVLAGVVEMHEVVFLSGGELGLFAAEPTLRPGDLHAFAGAHPDQVGLAGVGDGAGEPVQLGDD